MMRFQKYILLLAITLISAITIQAQNIGGGIIVGFNASQVSGDNAAGYDKIGLNTGVIGMVPFNDKWSANIEINYAQRGSRIQGWNYNINYIDVPIYAVYSDREKYHFGIGLLYGSMLNKTPNSFSGFVDYNLEYLLNFQTAVSSSLDLNFRFSRSIIPLDVIYNSNIRRNQQMLHYLFSVRMIYMIKRMERN
jgi:hypothetical protein